MAGPYTAFVYGDPQINNATLTRNALIGYSGSGGGGSSGPIPVAVVLPPAYLGTPYSETITANGGTGPYTYAIFSGSLPTGLSLSSAGVISGTPTGTIGTSSFTIKVTDSTSATGTEGFSIAVGNPPASNWGFTT